MKASVRSSLSLYLGDIGARPLLSREQEGRLAEQIREGSAEAKRVLIESNLRFVVSVAVGYRHRGLPLEDLISEASVGVVEAAGRYSPAREARFITYAVWWVRKAILTALREQGRIVKVTD